jgi:3-oxoacyl-[acyl-carrier-protein] synthase II
MSHRVVITGMGAVSPLGLDVPTLWQGLLEGRSGVAPITLFDTRDHETRIAAEVKGFDPSDYMDRKEARRSDRFVQFAVAAAQEAVRHAGLQITPANAARIGVIVGSGVGGLMTLWEQFNILKDRGPRAVSPFLVPMMISDMAAGQIAITHGAKGINYCTTSACASSAHAIGESFEAIRRGVADAIITGGCEAPLVGMAVAAFESARALSTRNDDPPRASRPFDAQRDGFVMGEGAVILILESLEQALRRGVPILAEVIGYGATGDAYHIAAPPPGGEGAARSMCLALAEAGLQPADVDYINAHGTSTPLNDIAETHAIKSAFGEHAYHVAISSTKSMVGHLLGAAGAIEAVACVQTLVTGMIHPTINYEFPDPECDLDYVPNQARRADVRIALSNSFGFGGHNCSLVFARYEDH